MVFERPNRPKKPQPSLAPIQRPHVASQNSGTGGRGGGGHQDTPSPWLNPEHQPTPDVTASFVEYLRWMRSPNSEYKDATKVQLLQMAEERANYSTVSTNSPNVKKIIFIPTFRTSLCNIQVLRFLTRRLKPLSLQLIAIQPSSDSKASVLILG